MKKNILGQSGVELVIVYGFVIMLIGGTVVVLSNMGSFNPPVCSKNQMGFSSLTPVDWGVYFSSNDVLVTLRNEFGTSVEVSDGLISLDDGLINCVAPSSSKVLSPGDSFVMNLQCTNNPTISGKYVVGSCYTADASFTYRDLETQRTDVSAGRLRGAIEKGSSVAIVTTTSSTTTTTTITTTTTTTSTPTTTTSTSTTSTSTTTTTTTTTTSTTTTTTTTTSTTTTTTTTTTTSTTTTTLFVCSGTITVTHVAGSVAPVNKTVTYGLVQTGIAGTGTKCWITQNLGATRQANGASDSSEDAAGWYWKFNKKQGWEYKTSLVPTPWDTSCDTSTLDVWDPTKDPCTLLLGAGWRIPTYTEWYTVDVGWSNIYNAFNSLLKVHSAGYFMGSVRDTRNGHYMSTRGGVYGTYNSASAWHLCCDTSSCLMKEGSYRCSGFSLRCIKD